MSDRLCLLPATDKSCFVAKADSIADWPVLRVALRQAYTIHARVKMPGTCVAKKDDELTRGTEGKLMTRNWNGRSAICLLSRLTTTAVYKREE
jgi:hypothetical protein